MQPPIERMILLPRFSAFNGEQTFKSAPVWVRDYASMIAAVWRGTAMGTLGSFGMTFYESPDLETWESLGTLSPTAGQESVMEYSFTADWMRFELALSGTDPAVSCWSVADLVPRHT